MSIKVLVADDSITIQKVIGIIFGGDEYSLTVVDNGKAAVDKAREINPDILLIDALMPGMSGYEVTEAVRSTPSLAAKPILIMTGSFEPFDEDKAKKCGADDFIAKPFESQQIITKVRELLELGSSRNLSAQTPQPQTEPEILYEKASEVSVPVFDIPTPVQQPEVPEAAPPADIWGAFTPEVEPPVAAAAVTPAVEDSSVAAIETDVFAIVTEENDSKLVQNIISEDTQPDHTGSQWVPVEENTFEFEEEAIAEPTQTISVEQTVPEPSFGDISFEGEEVTTPAPEFSAVPEPDFSDVPEPEPVYTAPVQDFVAPEPEFEPFPAPSEPFAPLADPTPPFAAPVESAPAMPAEVAAITAALTEDQLKAALAGVSKEVIERIVWEVVPDLAEALIREAIRKIKEGV